MVGACCAHVWLSRNSSGFFVTHIDRMLIFQLGVLSFGLMVLWITCVFLFLYAGLILYYVYHWYRVDEFGGAGVGPIPFISVVVAARNEAANLPRLLRALSRQTLTQKCFEIIVVDDYSTDKTATVVAPFLSERVRLIQPHVPPDRSSKKKAIAAGVARAQGQLIVVTDADCMPPPRWLELMTAFYRQKEAAFIVAPVQLIADKTFLGIFQQLDFMMLQGITAAGVQAGAHSMCNGANLAYEKAVFSAVNGFEGVDKRASGDDMLLMYKVYRKHPQRIHYLKHEEAIMPTPAQATWKSFLQQRIRWSSKAAYYQDKRVSAVLFFVYAFNLWCFFLFFALPVQPALWPYALSVLLMKAAIELILLWPVANFYGQTRLLPYFPLLQPVHVLYTVLIGLLSRRKTYEWKGRRTR